MILQKSLIFELVNYGWLLTWFFSLIPPTTILQDLSFSTLRNWVSSIDIKKFEILLCIGNKVDLVPGHQVHVEYRRRMQRHKSTTDPHPEHSNFGINEEEGSSLLWDEEPSIDIRKSSLDWCIDNNIEYVEACASNADFDKCKYNMFCYLNSAHPFVYWSINFSGHDLNYFYEKHAWEFI